MKQTNDSLICTVWMEHTVC